MNVEIIGLFVFSVKKFIVKREWLRNKEKTSSCPLQSGTERHLAINNGKMESG
jgi:hypothetical protein